jgi:hypothetical protein
LLQGKIGAPSHNPGANGTIVALHVDTYRAGLGAGNTTPPPRPWIAPHRDQIALQIGEHVVGGDGGGHGVFGVAELSAMGGTQAAGSPYIGPPLLIAGTFGTIDSQGALFGPLYQRTDGTTGQQTCINEIKQNSFVALGHTVPRIG